MGFDDAASDGEPESGSGHRLGRRCSCGLAAETHVEQPRDVGVGDAAALIAHPDDGRGTGVVVAKDATNRNVDRAAGGSVPDRVGNQIRERPIQLTDVAGNGEGSGPVTAQLNALSGGQWLEGRKTVGDDVVEGNPFGCHGERSGLDPGELEQVVHHRRQSIDVGVHALV